MIDMDKHSSIQLSLQTLGLPVFVTHKEIRDRYLALTKELHPDISGENEEIYKLNSAYEELKEYIDNFRFMFDKEEVTKQCPGEFHGRRFGF